jgi:type IV secretory pathway TraG/TraD family ATPase VirD4
MQFSRTRLSEILQLPAEHLLVFHRDLPPAGLRRANWLEHPFLVSQMSRDLAFRSNCA